MASYDYSKVLGTTELRNHIFALVDNTSLARCARVSSLWTDSALDLLWETMDNVLPLFQVVYPMVFQNRTGYVYPANYSGSWKRFLRYGRRIKHFILKWSSICRLSEAAINEISRRRPSFSITPNLETLSIQPEQKCELAITNFSLLLLHESIGHITISIPQDKFVFSSFLNLFVLRVQKLRSLEFRVETNMTVDHFEDNFVGLLSELNELSTLRLPYHSLTPKVIVCLQDHPRLRSISFHDGPAPVRIPDLKPPSLNIESFPTLNELQISGSFALLAPFLSAGCFEKSLTSLVVQVVSLERPTTLSMLLEIVMRSLPMLSCLTVDGIPQSLSFEGFSREAMDVSQTTFDSVTAMTKLVEFSISWPVPFSISDSRLASILSGMPRIEKLSLNSCPAAVDGSPGLSLDVLPTVAKLCPNLRSLALYVDCTVVPNWNASVYAELDDQRKIVPFTRLKEFDLGLSPLGQDDWSPSMCLSKILPTYCNLTYRNRWLNGVEGVVERKFGSLKVNRWPGKYDTIGRLTRHLIFARNDERYHAFARIRALEDRIRALEVFKVNNDVDVLKN